MVKGQMKIMQMSSVAREIRLADQNYFVILDKKSFANESRNFQFNSTCSTGGFWKW